GFTLPLYGDRVELLVGIEPSVRLLSMASRRVAKARVQTALLRGTAAHLPLRDAAVDTVVLTWTLCSIPEPQAALREIRRGLALAGAPVIVQHRPSPRPRGGTLAAPAHADLASHRGRLSPRP